MLNLFVPNQNNDYKPYLLRNGALAVYTLLLLLINTFGGLLGLDTVHASSITSNNIVSLTNVQRQKYGLANLKTDSRLSAAALAKANNMFKVGYWNHFGPNGETPWQFIKGAQYSYVYAGENLAKGFKSSEGVVEAWMASPTHRDNLLSGNYKDIGVAVVDGVLQGESVTLVVQMFGNQTNTVVQTPTPITTPLQSEKGETMSIKITDPKEGAILNDATVDLKGKVTNSDGIYKVEISDKGVPSGAFETNGTTWEWDKKSDWSEGEHTVTAKIKGEKASDTTKFVIDTTAPHLKSFQAVIGTDSWSISGSLDDKEGTISLVSDEYIRTFEVDEEGSFTGEVLLSNIGDNVKVITTDTLGNTVETDVSDYFDLENDGSVLSVFNNIINNLGSKDTLNAIFLGFILLLLLIEVITYWRRGLLAKHGGNLFTLAFWWMLLLFGVVNGFSGTLS